MFKILIDHIRLIYGWQKTPQKAAEEISPGFDSQLIFPNLFRADWNKENVINLTIFPAAVFFTEDSVAKV